LLALAHGRSDSWDLSSGRELEANQFQFFDARVE
jgi:hypothetical protein